MRPRGDCSRALASAAAQPGTVVQLAHRSQVSVPVARYTASRMLDRGELVVLQASRPAVLVAPDATAAPEPSEPSAFELLARSFWEHQGVP